MSDASGTTPEVSPGDPKPSARPPVPGVPPYGQLPYGQVPYHHHPYGTPGYGAPLRDPDARPGTVLAAGIVTLVMTGIVLLLLLVGLFFLLAARADFMEGFGDQAGLRGSDLAGANLMLYWAILVALGVFIVWCLAAIVLAVLTLRRSNAARIGLVVSASMTSLVSLLAITAGAPVVTLAAGVAVAVCLFNGGAGDWFRREHMYSPPTLPKL